MKLTRTNYNIKFEEKSFKRIKNKNLYMGLGRNGAKIFFYFPIYLIQLNDNFSSKIKLFIH